MTASTAVRVKMKKGMECNTGSFTYTPPKLIDVYIVSHSNSLNTPNLK
jgi:hypothetical protein